MAKSKILDISGDFKKTSTGGKVIYVLGGIYAATWLLNVVKTKTV